MDYKLSVVVPVYNLQAYLPVCLDSVLAQTLDGIEIIAVNDGSPDDSLRILQEYAARHPQIKIVDQVNQGAAGACNSGINAASGKYIGFVGNDDWVAPDMFETLWRLAEAADADIALCNYMICREGEAMCPAFFPLEPEVSSGHVWLNHIYRTPDFAPALQRCLLRRDWLNQRQLRFPKVRNAEDQQAACAMFAEAKRVAAIPASLYFYRIRQGSLSNTKDDQSLLHRIQAQLTLAQSLDRFMQERRGHQECYPILRWKLADSLLGVEHNLQGIKSSTLRSQAAREMAQQHYASLLWHYAGDFKQRRRAIKRLGQYWLRQLRGVH